MVKRPNLVQAFTGMLLAGLFFTLVQPVHAQGGKITFRNDTADPIIVQGFSVISRTVRAGTRHVLQPGQAGQDVILSPGNKLIVIQDAKQPTRKLHQETIVLTGVDLILSIQIAPPAQEEEPAGAGKARVAAKPAGPKFALVPVKPDPKPTKTGR